MVERIAPDVARDAITHAIRRDEMRSWIGAQAMPVITEAQVRRAIRFDLDHEMPISRATIQQVGLWVPGGRVRIEHETIAASQRDRWDGITCIEAHQRGRR